MEQSILKSTKKVLNIPEDYNAFDLDIMTHINSTFSVLNQIGIGPIEGFAIEDDTVVWADLNLSLHQLNLVKTYIYLKTRMLFDPPTTSFLLEATKEQIQEHEVRLSINRESVEWTPPPPIVVEEPL